MANFVGYRFQIPQARALASLESVRHDLEAVVQYCQRLEESKAQPFDPLIWEAVCAAAVVRYARCFSSGSRQHLEHSLLDGAPPELAEVHRYMVAVRSKHVAHSVNEFEENDVTVVLRHDGESVEISGIGAHHGRKVGLALHQPVELKALTEWVLARVQVEITKERAPLLDLARSLGAERIRHEFGQQGIGGSSTPENAFRGRPRP